MTPPKLIPTSSSSSEYLPYTVLTPQEEAQMAAVQAKAASLTQADARAVARASADLEGLTPEEANDCLPSGTPENVKQILLEKLKGSYRQNLRDVGQVKYELYEAGCRDEFVEELFGNGKPEKVGLALSKKAAFFSSSLAFKEDVVRNDADKSHEVLSMLSWLNDNGLLVLDPLPSNDDVRYQRKLLARLMDGINHLVVSPSRLNDADLLISELSDVSDLALPISQAYLYQLCNSDFVSPINKTRSAEARIFLKIISEKINNAYETDRAGKTEGAWKGAKEQYEKYLIETFSAILKLDANTNQGRLKYAVLYDLVSQISLVFPEPEDERFFLKNKELFSPIFDGVLDARIHPEFKTKLKDFLQTVYPNAFPENKK